MRIVAVLTVCGLALAGCGGGTEAGPEPTTTPAPAQSSPPQPTPTDRSTPPGTATPTGTGIQVAASNFGEVLFDSTGQAIYLFDKEKTATSECYDACAEAWPPVLTKAMPKALGRVEQSLLGTTRRTDGTTQVTYGGHPLYFYAHEDKNEVKCHNIPGFGGLWLAVTAAGEAAPV
ncbi:hypothetical protein ACIBL3_39865 [Kribbella sp. NPDC050124]|uniref:hypothetical protein n=1 Tax=Kribbella sp. NPDC050124 TaxID=3364114 RepID=UPI0037B0ACFA